MHRKPLKNLYVQRFTTGTLGLNTGWYPHDDAQEELPYVCIMFNYVLSESY